MMQVCGGNARFSARRLLGMWSGLARTALIALLLAWTSTAVAATKSTKPTKPGASKSRTAATSAAAAPNKRPPTKPNPTLPNGAPRRPEDLSARQSIAGGAPRAGVALGVDEQLRALQEAERILFPQPLEGLLPGWTWDRSQAEASPPSGVPTGIVLEPRSARARASEAEWLQSLRLPNTGARMDALVVKYLKFYRDSEQGQRIAKNWARKVGRYAPALRAAFAKAGLPSDLMWLSLIESGHNPVIYSVAGAAGLWQFIPETGRLYGLTVDRWVDERLDPFQATHAAIKFLSDLHQRFGNWELAMAAYNMGPAGLLRSMRKFNTNDFWRLTNYEAGLPWETTLYVPKVLAIAVVMNNLKAFGLDDIEPEPAAEFDTIEIEEGTTLGEIARASGLELRELEAINPQLLTGRAGPAAGEASPKRPHVYLPAGKGSAALRALKPASARQQQGTHRVRFGDTFATIAQRYGTDEATLTSLNGGSATEHLRQGTVMWVPDAPLQPKPDVEETVVVSPERFAYPDRERVFYRVRHLDSLEEVAQAFSVSAEQVRWWNDLDPSALLQEGMALQVYVSKAADLSAVRHLKPSETRMLVVGTETFLDHHEELAGRRRIVVTAKDGETLSTLGKRYGMSSGMMERINHFSRNRPLVQGEQVIVYTKLLAEQSDSTMARAATPLETLKAPRPEALPPLPADARSEATP